MVSTVFPLHIRTFLFHQNIYSRHEKPLPTMTRPLFIHSFRLIVSFAMSAILKAAVVFSAPIGFQSSVPLQQSGDVWASVVANVAPLMALVGERNAKEYMRTTATWHQLLPLSSAPLGILAILVSAIRLSGPGFLRRLVGRDSERRSEALVELTPLSVRPATSVYTPRGVEIETTFDKDNVAFVCGHVKEVPCHEAVSSFRQILRNHKGGSDQDKDMEAVLVLWSRNMPIENVAELANYITTPEDSELPIKFDNASTAALSYRTTGISPTQAETNSIDMIQSFHKLRDIVAFFIGVFLMVGIQILGVKFGTSSVQTLYMGIVGYLAVVAFNFCLLVMVKGEIVAEKEILPKAFDKAMWTFSNSRHSEHKRMKRPASNTLITARPRNVTARDKFWRGLATTALTMSLMGSYVLYYLAMRVATWWVSLCSLGVIWSGALYRAITSTKTMVALSDEIGHDEHWIGLFRHTLSESILATMSSTHTRSLNCEIPLDSNAADKSDQGDYVVVEKVTATTGVQEINSEINTILFIVQPVRKALRTWSGAEDVMKVGLEMAKIACRKKVVAFPSKSINSNSRWYRIVRLRLAIYIPGLVWKSHHNVDFAVTHEFTIDSLIRDVLKLLHICMNQTGTISRHTIEDRTSVEISHVLCGPIADPPVNTMFSSTNPTLREVMAAIRDNEANAESRKFSVEQTLLLPTIILSCIYDRWLHSGMFGNKIEGLQGRHIDKLGLSGKAWLGSLQNEFKRLQLWEDFMVEANEVNDVRQTTELAGRDATSGNYAVHNAERFLQTFITTR